MKTKRTPKRLLVTKKERTPDRPETYSTTAGFDNNDEISRYQVSADDSPEGRERGISAFREMMKYGFNDVIETTINGDFRALQAALLDREGWIMKMEEIPL